MRKKEKIIIEFLRKRYQAKVIIIVGSRVVGDFKPNSDWDIYIFTNKKLPKETLKQFYNALPKGIKDEDLDVYKNSMKSSSYPAKLWRDLRNSKIVLDTKAGFGRKLRKRALEIYRKGPKKWTKSYAQGREYKARRYEKKFEDNLKDKKYGELFLRISWHYTENIVDWWFGIRQEFLLRPQQAFPYIRKIQNFTDSYKEYFLIKVVMQVR